MLTPPTAVVSVVQLMPLARRRPGIGTIFDQRVPRNPRQWQFERFEIPLSLNEIAVFNVECRAVNAWIFRVVSDRIPSTIKSDTANSGLQLPARESSS